MPRRRPRRPRLSAVGDAEDDLISALHDDLLGKIITILPVKEAARTAALASRWRHVWRSTPLVLYDVHLSKRTRAAAVSRILADHPGPFRTVSVVLRRCMLTSLSPELAEWPRLIAAKTVQNLDFINVNHTEAQPCLPADILGCTSLRNAFLANWTLPDHLSRIPVAFPHLRMIKLMDIPMSAQDVDHLIAASPVLERFLLGCPVKRFHLRSQSLWSVVLSLVEEFAVVEAPLLERLIFFKVEQLRNIPMKVKIASSTSSLRVLGYIDPMTHKLQINGNTIKPDTMASPSTVVPSIKILALMVNFCVLEEVKMVPSLLRCFPNVHTLHIQSVMREPTGEQHAKFWQEVSPIECLSSHVKEVVFHKFRGHQNEFEFLKFVARDVKVLQSLLLVPHKEVLSTDEVNEMIDKLGCPSFRAWTSKVLLVSPEVENDWSPLKGFDITVVDPFH